MLTLSSQLDLVDRVLEGLLQEAAADPHSDIRAAAASGRRIADRRLAPDPGAHGRNTNAHPADHTT